MLFKRTLRPKVMLYVFLSCCFSYAGDEETLHSLAQRGNWPAIRNKISEAGAEGLNQRNEDGKTVLDVAATVISPEHSFYQWLKEKRDLSLSEREKGLEAIRDKIEAQVNREDLNRRSRDEELKETRRYALERIQKGSEDYLLRDDGSFVMTLPFGHSHQVYVVYRDRFIGRGAWGSVFFGLRLKADHEDRDEIIVAKKIPKTTKAADVYQNEVKRSKDLGLCQASIETKDDYFMLMKYGGIKIGDLPTDLPMSLRKEIALGLLKEAYHLHKRGILHRDIKYDNYLISIDSRNALVLTLCDFGESCSKRKATNEFMGTPEFQTPESFSEDAPKFSSKDDNYGIGILMALVLSGAKMDEFQADVQFQTDVQMNNRTALMKAIPSIFNLSPLELNTIKDEDFLHYKLIKTILAITHKNPEKRLTHHEIGKRIVLYEDILRGRKKLKRKDAVDGNRPDILSEITKKVAKQNKVKELNLEGIANNSVPVSSIESARRSPVGTGNASRRGSASLFRKSSTGSPKGSPKSKLHESSEGLSRSSSAQSF